MGTGVRNKSFILPMFQLLVNTLSKKQSSFYLLWITFWLSAKASHSFTLDTFSSREYYYSPGKEG